MNIEGRLGYPLAHECDGETQCRGRQQHCTVAICPAKMTKMDLVPCVETHRYLFIGSMFNHLQTLSIDALPLSDGQTDHDCTS